MVEGPVARAEGVNEEDKETSVKACARLEAEATKMVPDVERGDFRCCGFFVFLVRLCKPVANRFIIISSDKIFVLFGQPTLFQ